MSFEYGGDPPGLSGAFGYLTGDPPADVGVVFAASGGITGQMAAAVDVVTPPAIVEVAAVGVISATFASAADITTPPATVTFDDSGTLSGTVAALVDIVTPAVVVVIDASGQLVGTFAATAEVLQSIIASVSATGAIDGLVSASVETADVAVVPTSTGSTARLIRWADKDPRESFTISFAFPGVPTDVVINVDVYSQYGLTDPNPESIFNGSFQVNGNVVSQAVARDQGVDLVDYYIDCVATVNGERLVAAGCLPVRTK